MRPLIIALLASAPVVLASQTVFSVHDDLLAFPQYEVVFSGAFISDADATFIIEHASASSTVQSPPKSSNSKSIDSQHSTPNSPVEHVFDPAHETYEIMNMNGEKHLCTIPIVEPHIRNETSEAEARATEQKELARATDRGWELLKDLDGNCLYFISGWWSYSFCYNSEIKQFHQLPPQPGKPAGPPQPDPNTKEYVLGKAKPTHEKQDEWGNQVDVHRGPKHSEHPKTELQIKGDTRYLVQKMEGGTICDLTGKPRKVEVQYHCNPQVTDRIGYIKEVTTCSYVMVVYTPRLCDDVAFLPPKEEKANEIVCRVIVPEDELLYRSELHSLEAELEAASSRANKAINIGGLILGAGKWANKEGLRLPTPATFGSDVQGRTTEIIARGKSKAEGGKVDVLSDADLQERNLDPKMISELKSQMKKIAQEKGWIIKVVDAPGEVREILGITDDDPENNEDDDDDEGSEEVYKDEL